MTGGKTNNGEYMISPSKTDTGEMLEIVGHGYDEERQFYIVHLAKVFNAFSFSSLLLVSLRAKK